MKKFLIKKYFPQYLSSLNLDINTLFSTIQEKEWSAENFRFYTAVSVMSSAKRELSIAEVFYFAALIHLVFVKIHSFDDGNGRTARLLEKWFIAMHLGEKVWYIGSESYYYQNLKMYYQNLARTSLFYDELDYEKGLPFLLMLPNALMVR